MNIINLTSKLLTVLGLFYGAAQAMKPTSTVTQKAGHDKFITQVRIDGKNMPDFQRIYFMPYSGGPRMGVQEVSGVTLNGIQDYATARMQKGKWKPPYTLVYTLEKPVLINATTHNPELTVVIEMLDESCKMWTFNNGEKFREKFTTTFDEMLDEKLGEFNELYINLGATRAHQQATLNKISK